MRNPFYHLDKERLDYLQKMYSKVERMPFIKFDPIFDLFQTFTPAIRQLIILRKIKFLRFIAAKIERQRAQDNLKHFYHYCRVIQSRCNHE